MENPDDEMGRLAAVFNETLGRLQRSFEQMRQFTSDVSHELRTPLTSIRSVGEVGLRGHPDEQGYRTIIGSMLEEADRLAGLVDRLLTLSRAETGQAPLSREVVDLQALADNVVSHLSVLAEEKQQQIVVERNATPSALADRQVLRQALINLVDNAIKFTPVGGAVRVRVSETPREAVCDVVDSGPGVPPAARQHIFDRFYRFGDASALSGAGLGLSIARGAVEANGGRLTLVESGESGSTFRISMPRVSTARARTANSAVEGGRLQSVGRLSSGGHRAEALAHRGHRLLRARPLHDHLLEVHEVVGVAGPGAVLGQERLDLGQDDQLLAVGVVEHLLVDGAVGDERRRHVPVARHHAEVAAMRPRHRRHHVVDRPTG